MSYPVTILSAWASTLIVIGLIAVAYSVARKTKSVSPLGGFAVVFAGLTGWTWFTSLPGWTAWFVLILTATLFGFGMTRSDAHDDKWHYGALVVALFGKMIMGLVPAIVDALNGEVTVNGWTLAFVLGIVGGVLIAKSNSVQRLIRRAKPDTTPPPETATT